jgi:hypothetical protein
MSTTSTDTYDQVGIREDLVDSIYNVDPTEVPFLSMAPKVKASNTLHEWQTDTFETASDNKAVEGADATFTPASATVRLTNYTQIAQKTAQISKTLEATDRAGRDKEMNYQMLKRGIEIKRDMETTLVGTNKAKAAGNATTARDIASILSWINTNTSIGGGGADPTGDGTDARTDGTQRAFTEGLLETVIDACWNAGGKPDTVMVGSFNKRAMNAFVGRSTSTDHPAESRSIISAMDVYVSDYGNLKVVPNRFSRARDALVYQRSMWAVAFLRNMSPNEIAPTGDSDKKQIVTEYTLEARNEKSSGLVADLTTS